MSIKLQINDCNDYIKERERDKIFFCPSDKKKKHIMKKNRDSYTHHPSYSSGGFNLIRGIRHL